MRWVARANGVAPGLQDGDPKELAAVAGVPDPQDGDGKEPDPAAHEGGDAADGDDGDDDGVIDGDEAVPDDDLFRHPLGPDGDQPANADAAPANTVNSAMVLSWACQVTLTRCCLALSSCRALPVSLVWSR